MTRSADEADSRYEQSLESRYGRRPARRQGGFAVVVVVAALVLLGWALWAAFGPSGSQVGALVQSYTIRSAHQVSVTVQVTRTGTGPVSCVVSAVASDHSDVGQTVVTLPAGTSGTKTVTTTIKTERGAATAVVDSCH